MSFWITDGFGGHNIVVDGLGGPVVLTPGTPLVPITLITHQPERVQMVNQQETAQDTLEPEVVFTSEEAALLHEVLSGQIFKDSQEPDQVKNTTTFKTDQETKQPDQNH